MAVYSDIFVTNKAGVHVFPATVVTDLSLTLTEQVDVPDGVRAKLSGDLVLLHKNGRVGPIDLTKDALVVSITLLQKLSDAIQTALRSREILPVGAVR